MCTLSFTPRPQGYFLAMNRDEQRTRAIALPPARQPGAPRVLLGPQDPRGGRWIVLNDAGVSYALLNWNRVKTIPAGPHRSRGEVINMAGPVADLVQAHKTLLRLLPDPFRPFRLIGIFPDLPNIMEWCWNCRKLTRREHPWTQRLWSSSGWDEDAVQRSRSKVFAALNSFSQRHPAGLRKFHASHLPEKGPLAVCMHREDAVTVSYSEIQVFHNRGVFRYRDGSPCRRSPFTIRRIALDRPGSLLKAARPAA